MEMQCTRIYTEQGCTRIASAVLLQAVRDLQHPKRRKKAIEFFGPKGGRWFEVLTEASGLKPENVRRKVEIGDLNKVDFKLPYRSRGGDETNG